MATPQLANSINGYVAKLLFRQRSQRTLLVEGESDKLILSSLLLRVSQSKAKPPVLIDTAETIKNSGLGNRERVEHVHHAARQQGVLGYACLADREFRHFKCTTPYEDTLASHLVQDDVLFWTRGHSVENYLFVIESVLRYLQINYAVHLLEGHKELVEKAFHPIMTQAVAFSLAAYDSALIKRADRIVTLQDWSFRPDQVPQLDVSRIGVALAQRAAQATQVTQFEAAYGQHLTALGPSPLPFLRWISHGHLGSQILWSGIAFLFSRQGFDAEATDQLARGENDQKCKIGADLWADRCGRNSPEETPTLLMQWIAG